MRRPVLTTPQPTGEGSRFEGQEGGSTLKIFPVLGLQIYNQQFACIRLFCSQVQTLCFHLTSPVPVHHSCWGQTKPFNLYGFCGLPFAMVLAVTPCPGISRWSPTQNTGLAQDCSAPTIRCAQPSAPGFRCYNHIETHRSEWQEPAQHFKTITR